MFFFKKSWPDPASVPYALRRLGIHLLCALVCSIAFRMIIDPNRMGSPSIKIMVRDFTELWFQGNIMLWGFSLLVPNRWLTEKRVWTGIPLINLVGLLLILFL